MSQAIENLEAGQKRALAIRPQIPPHSGPQGALETLSILRWPGDALREKDRLQPARFGVRSK